MARILVIDDEIDIVRAIVRILSARGHEVDTGRDGYECIQRVRTDPPDVLVVDAALPGIDGLELVRHLKMHPSSRHVPIVLMSANYLSLDGTDVRADEYVVKPFTREVLIANVERLIHRT